MNVVCPDRHMDGVIPPPILFDHGDALTYICPGSSSATRQQLISQYERQQRSLKEVRGRFDDGSAAGQSYFPSPGRRYLWARGVLEQDHCVMLMKICPHEWFQRDVCECFFKIILDWAHASLSVCERFLFLWLLSRYSRYSNPFWKCLYPLFFVFLGGGVNCKLSWSFGTMFFHQVLCFFSVLAAPHISLFITNLLYPLSHVLLSEASLIFFFFMMCIYF